MSMKIRTNLSKYPTFSDVPMGDIFALKENNELYVKANVNGYSRAISIREGKVVAIPMNKTVRVAKNLDITF